MTGNIHNTSIIDSKAIIDSSVIIGPYCIIGPNAIIGPNVEMEKCVIRDSVILDNVNGYGGIIKNCIIGPNISFKEDLDRTLISPEGTITF